jgi:hypothetical protein
MRPEDAQVENVRSDNGHLDWRWPVWIAQLQGRPQLPAYGCRFCLFLVQQEINRRHGQQQQHPCQP